MKIFHNGVSVSFDKNLVKEIVINGGELTIINAGTIDQPKMVDDYESFDCKENFTGVVKDKEGNIAHYVNGKFHRKDGPAIEMANGTKCWFVDGKEHREDGPSTEFTILDGLIYWCFNGEYHGENDDFTKESWMAYIATLK